VATVALGPTGQQHGLAFADHAATVVEIGGGLRDYRVGDRPVLDGFAASEEVDGGRGQLLVPWPNRVGDGRYPWAGGELQLEITEPGNGNAIHGLLRRVPWSLLRREPSRVVMGVRLEPRPGYPFMLEVEADYSLGPDGLVVAVTARNVGQDPAPYGIGQHPYFTVGTALVDDALLTVPAECWMRTDERGLPVATEPVAGTPYDFRSPRRVGDLRLDTPYAELARDGSGRSVVRLSSPAGGPGLDVWLGDGAHFLQVFSGDTLPDPARRRRGLAVEPMSCPPDAFRSGIGLVTLETGGSHTLRWGVTPL
jgi:aldose 1-epimerase